MKPIILCAATVLAATTLTGCGLRIKSHDEVKTIEKTININEPFTAIEAFGMTDVKYTDGPTSIKLSAPAVIIDEIEVFVKGGTLYVGRDGQYSKKGYIESHIEISHPGVDTFITSGTGDFEIKSLNGKDITMETSGTGDFDCGTINCTILNANSNGTGDIEIKRLVCSKAGLFTDGTGDINVDNVQADTVKGYTNGTGDLILKGVCKFADLSEFGTGDVVNRLKIKD